MLNGRAVIGVNGISAEIMLRGQCAAGAAGCSIGIMPGGSAALSIREKEPFRRVSSTMSSFAGRDWISHMPPVKSDGAATLHRH
jgi:hypothetical protein